jgi:hypothetical protein
MEDVSSSKRHTSSDFCSDAFTGAFLPLAGSLTSFVEGAAFVAFVALAAFVGAAFSDF